MKGLTIFFLTALANPVLCLSKTQATPSNVITTLNIPSASPTVDPSGSWRHNRARQSKHVHEFFKSFGWLRPNDTIRDGDLPKAIRRIQHVLQEPETGVYDERMEEVMSRPRCGTIQPYNETDATTNSPLNKRYVLWGPKWDRTTITYRFVNYTADLPSDEQRSTIGAAFNQWTQYLPINIVPAATNARADIHIIFRTMGPTETMYAFTNLIADGLSLSSGLINVTFNDNINWADDRFLNFTAVHEIGHALGLSHSKVEQSIMWPYFDGVYRPMHPDDQAAVHVLYGWKNPRWNKIDANSATNSIIQVSSTTTNPALLDGLYQLRTNGQVLRYSSSAWTTIDNNKDTAQIAGANGTLYQRHTDGSIYKYSGTGSNWQWIGVTNDNVIDIVAAADQLYQRRKDGWIARWSGSGTQWQTIEQPQTPLSRQIAVTESKTLWNLLTNGDVVRSAWPYNNGGWAVVNQDTANIAIAVGGEEFYKLQSDGRIVWLDMQALFWRVVEDAWSVDMYAVGQYLYSRHRDGSIWRYTGTPMVWEMLDGAGASTRVIGDRRGAVWQMVAGGDVLKLVS